MSDESPESCPKPSPESCPTSVSPSSSKSGPDFVGRNREDLGSDEVGFQIRTITLSDLARSLLLYSIGSRIVPPVFPESIYRWAPDGLFGVAVIPTDLEGECGPILGLCLGSDPPQTGQQAGRRVKLKYWWTSGALKVQPAQHLEVEMFEAFFARLPEWVASVSTHVNENDQRAINTCVACRMRAIKTIHHEDTPDTLVFSRPVLKELNR